MDARGWSDERDAFLLEASDEGSVLCKESVAWVNGIALEFLCRLHHRLDIQVGIKWIGSIVRIGDVRHLNGRRVGLLGRG